MKYHSYLLGFLLLLTFIVKAQTTDTLAAKSKSQAIAFGLYLPVGTFSQSHIAGAGFEYSWSRHRFGKNRLVGKAFGFVANAGINYYLGKKINTTGHEFRYGDYLNVYAMPGIIYNPVKNGNVSLAAGPALNIYKGSANAGIAVCLFSNYFFAEKIALGPGVIFKKHTTTDALWAVTIRASYSF